VNPSKEFGGEFLVRKDDLVPQIGTDSPRKMGDVKD
jgi:hypothetical protein